MDAHKKSIRIPLPWLILFVFALLICVCWLLFAYFRPVGQTWNSPGGPLFLIAAGLVPGLAVALGQYTLDWFEFVETDRLRQLKVKRILVARDDMFYYQNLIRKSEKSIMVLGVTASRFLNDFAAEENRPEKRVLIDALVRKIHVKLLIAAPDFLSDKDRTQRYPDAESRLKTLLPQYPNLEVKYYKHEPAHSIFMVDDDCLLGPVFGHLESRDTPAIHTSANSPFAKSYLEYFNYEWANN